MKPKLNLETINALTEHPRKEQSFDQNFFFFFLQQQEKTQAK
jgi:hypothetical protein